MTPTTEELQEQNTIRTRLHARRETFRIAVPGSDEEYAAWLSGFDEASDIALASQEREAKLVEALERQTALVDELCESVDCAAEDIGGQRSPLTILQDLGPHLTECRNALTAYRAQTEGEG